jgi:vacuolar protein-sorting-associated protein 4
MEGLGTKDSNILVLGATNLPWNLDPAIRQRFEKRVHIPLPDTKARSAMVKMGLRNTPNNLSEDDYITLGRVTEGASGREIKVLVKEALYEPVVQCQRAKHFKLDGNFYVPCRVSLLSTGAVE